MLTPPSCDQLIYLNRTTDTRTNPRLHQTSILQVFRSKPDMRLTHRGGSGLRNADKMSGTHRAIGFRVLKGDLLDIEGWLISTYTYLSARQHILASQA